jgi:CRP-like cAMP-binding protein
VATGELKITTTLPSDNKAAGNAKGYLCNKVAGDIINKGQAQKDAKRKVSQAKLGNLVSVDDLNIETRTDSLLLGMDEAMFDTFLTKHSSIRPSMELITKSNIADSLKQLPFLQGIKESQMNLLAAMCRYEAFDEKAYIFNQGDSGDKLYMVLNGTCDVLANKDMETAQPEPQGRKFRRSMNKTVNGELFSTARDTGLSTEKKSDETADTTSSPRPSGVDEEHVHLATLETGSYFGETALMVNIPRTTSVVTKTKSLLLTVGKTEYNNFLMVCPEVKQGMQKVMKDRMMSKLSSMDIPFFQGINPSELAMSVEMHEFDKDIAVFKAGDTGDRFYIIIHGEVRIETNFIPDESAESDSRNSGADDSGRRDKMKRSMSMDIGHLGPGKYFGEMALVNDGERMATIVCNAHSIIMSIGKEVFHKIFDANPQALVEFKLRLLQTKAELKNVLEHTTGMERFREYLKKELADENLKFYEAVRVFKANFNKADAMTMYTNYVAESAECQVNVPGKMRQAVKAVIDSGEFDETVFDKCDLEIYKLMVRDNYARFKKSAEFKDFFAQLGIFIEA